MAKDKDRKNDKRDAKVDKLSAKANLALAKAQKRKRLYLLICAAIAAYVVISKGGINLGGILDKIKGLSP